MTSKKLESSVFGLKRPNQMFWAQGRQNEENGSKIVPINLMKIFHEHDVNDVKKVRIRCFWAKEAEISLRPLPSSNHRHQNFS